MGRNVAFANAALVAALVVLCFVDSRQQRRVEERRLSESTFVPIRVAAPAPVDVARLRVRIGTAPEVWTCERRPDGWRIAEYHDGFALTRNVEGVLAAILDSRGIPVGRVPQDEKRFGLRREESLNLELTAADGRELLRVRAGRIVPGDKAEECFMTAEGSGRILQTTGNPWPFLRSAVSGRLPPLADPHVLPLARGGQSIARITFSGPDAGTVRTLTAREIPVSPEVLRKSGHRIEWYGTFPGSAERRLDDAAAGGFARSVATLEFDELVGERGQHEDRFFEPRLTLTIDAQDGSTNVLLLGSEGERGRRYLLNEVTGQVFLVSEEKARRLVPDPAALAERSGG